MKIYTLFPLIALSGCQTTQPVTVDIAPLSSQIERLTEANLKLDRLNHDLDLANGQLREANGRLLAQIRADAEAGQTANGKGWLAFEGYVWGQQILRLPDIIADAPTEARWAEAATLYQAGGESAMQGVIADLQGDAAETNQTLGELRESIKSITAQRDAANEAASQATIELERVRGETASLVEQARAAERAQLEAENIRRQQWVLNGAAALCVLVSLASLAAKFWLKMDTGMLSVALGLVGAPACLALGQATGKSWFLPVACTVAGVVVIAAGLAVVRGSTAVRTAKAAQTQLELTMSTMTKIVRRLDTCYEDTSTTLQSLMDKTPARPAMTLSDLIDEQVLAQAGMTDTEKAEVHRLRMVAKQEAAAQKSAS
jgi:hypothetical protein